MLSDKKERGKVEMIGKNNEVWEGLDQYGKVCDSGKETGKQPNDKDNGSQRNGKEIRKEDGNVNNEGGNSKEKVEEEKKWPCGVCGEEVTNDGIECVVCNGWYCVGECTETVSATDFINKRYTCQKCLEKSGGKARKPKAIEKVKKGPGRPRRDRSYSIPSSLSEDRIAKNIESKRKRNIAEVGSPGKAEETLEEKKRKKEREETEKKEGEKKKVEEEDEHLSPMKRLFSPFKRIFSSEEKRKKQKEEKEKEKNKQTEREQKEESKKNEKAKEKDEKNDGEEGEVIETQKECNPPVPEKEKEKTKTLGQKRKAGNSHIEYYGIKITREDLKSLEGVNWLTSTALEGFLARLEDTKRDKIKDNKILLIQPSIAQILQYGDRESACEHKKLLKTKEYDWIFYPIQKTSYPETGKLDGGIHWSLMIFSKKGHSFLHYDSIRGMNERGAKEMVINMGDVDDFNDRGHWPAFQEVDCSRQDNNWACGSYLMHYMDKAIQKIVEGRDNDIGSMHPVQHEVLKTREKLRLTIEKSVQKDDKEVEITYENVHIGRGDEKKKQDTKRSERKNSIQGEDENMEVDSPDTNIDEIPESEKRKSKVDRNIADINKNHSKTEKTGKISKECRFYLKGFCRLGDQCRFEHRELCGIWMKTGRCESSRCKLAHQYKCKFSGNCRRQNCRYLHPNKGTASVGEPKRENNAGVMNQGRINGQYQGAQQGRNWNQNQYGNRNFYPQNQMDYRINPVMAPWGMQQMHYGGPLTMETVLRAGWETLTNQGNMWKT